MTITVKFFARLREELGSDTINIEADNIDDVRSTWVKATGRSELPPNTFCAINQQHAKLNQAVKDGDEVAFFPQITGG